VTPVQDLRQTERFAKLAVPVAFAADGERWIAADEHELVVYAGDREEARYPVMVGGTDDQLAPLPRGGWIAGARVLAADGSVRFDGWGWAQKYGRFGSPKASSISADGSVAIIYGADSASTCLCDRDRGPVHLDGALVRLSLDREQIVERVLVDKLGEYQVAASPTAVAAWSWGELSVWPATGDAAPETAKLDGTIDALVWASERYLVAVRYIGTDREDIVVLDRDAGWQPAWTWAVPGYIRGVAVRPGTGELAILWTNYYATDRVYRDDRKLGVFALDGTRRVERDTGGYPSAVAWSPRGDALLVSTTGLALPEAAVTRFAVE